MSATLTLQFTGLFAIVLGSAPGTPASYRPEAVLMKTDCSGSLVKAKHDPVLLIRAQNVAEGMPDRVLSMPTLEAYAIWSIAGQVVTVEGDDKRPTTSIAIPELVDFDELEEKGAGMLKEGLLIGDDVKCPAGARVRFGDGTFRVDVAKDIGRIYFKADETHKNELARAPVVSVKYLSPVKAEGAVIHVGVKTIRLKSCGDGCLVQISNEPLDFAGHMETHRNNVSTSESHFAAFYELSAKTYKSRRPAIVEPSPTPTHGTPEPTATPHFPFDAKIQMHMVHIDMGPLCRDNPGLFYRGK